MVEVVKYFLDTYALVEIVRGNPLYKKFVDKALYTSLPNLYELYYNYLKDYGKEAAKDVFYRFFDYIVFIKTEHIFKASAFRLDHKNKDISYVDALGYAIAKVEDMKFVTGDKAFKGMKNVEFVP